MHITILSAIILIDIVRLQFMQLLAASASVMARLVGLLALLSGLTA
jgi:hypothetical protein